MNLKKLRRQIKQNTGFSLVEVLASLGISSILMLGLSYSFLNMSNKFIDVQNKSMENIYTTSFFNYLLDAEFCSKELTGNYLPSSTSGIDPATTTNIPCYDNSNAASVELCQFEFRHYRGLGYEGLPIKEETIFKESDLKLIILKLSRKPKINGQEFEDIVKDSTGRILSKRFFARLYIQFKNLKSNKNLKVNYTDVLVSVNPISSQIESCGNLPVVQSLCEAMGGQWNAESRTCVPESHCFLKGYYTKLATNNPVRSTAWPTKQGATINPYTGDYTCSPGISPTKIGQYLNTYMVYWWKHGSADIVDTYTIYICLKCT